MWAAVIVIICKCETGESVDVLIDPDNPERYTMHMLTGTHAVYRQLSCAPEKTVRAIARQIPTTADAYFR